MVTQEDYDALALKWARLVAELNELIGESDQLGVPITNGVNYLWNDLRLYLEGLPAQIREEGARRTAEPLTDWLESAGYERHNEPPDLEEQ